MASVASSVLFEQVATATGKGGEKPAVGGF